MWLTRVVVIALTLTVIHATTKSWELKENDDGNYNGDIYDLMLQEINEEERIESMLITYWDFVNDYRVEKFFEYAKPKIIITHNERKFLFREYFNTEMLSVVFMVGEMDWNLMDMLAEILDIRRQKRIFTVALDIASEEKFKRDFKEACKIYRMTRVLLGFLYSETPIDRSYYILRPYPIYRWLQESLEFRGQRLYFPNYWRNMENAPLVTYMGQEPPQSLLYNDKNGVMKLNGYMARFVMLFAEMFNASLTMYKPLEVGEVIQYRLLNQLANASLIDIPMALDISMSEPNSLEYKSVFFELATVVTVVPCGTPFTIREIFSLLLNEYFFGSLIICSVALSMVHSLIDYYFDGILNRWNFLLNDKILPGLLGMSSITRNAPWKGLKIVYILLAFAGLNISILFGANMNTLFTSHPYHGQLESLEDLHQSPINILIDELDTRNFGPAMPLFKKSLLITTNSSYVLEHKNKFNNTFGYIISTSTWDLFARRQEYYTKKLFCIMNKITIFPDFMPFSVVLPPHSPHQEAVDYLIFRVHEAGLKQAWQASTFVDMLKLKNISLYDNHLQEKTRVLLANDFFWIWMIVVIGLVGSSLVFLLELVLQWILKAS
ncbi:uncharacterized protein LOC142224471 [Haematobia irritans]|uniref:uncharacterized protein LOC142224471 n=1 Tax=Haematobia irritans TaxID=7368 RepID=UPI003F50606F